MKCALIFVSLIALGWALPLFQKATIRIVVAEDGTTTIFGDSGNKLVISRVLEHLGPKNVEIFVGVEQGKMKRILLDQETSVELVNAQYQTGLTEADILVQIFRNYQGDVDMNTYTHLLRQVHTHAQSGHVSMAVFNILKSFIVREASWKSQVSSDAVMTESVSPKWYSLLNRFGLKGTGFGFTKTTSNKDGALSLLHEASIRIAVADDGTISIYGASGNRVVISRVWEHLGPKNVEIFVGVEQGKMKRILLDQETSVEFVNSQYQTGWTEADILVQIFRIYQGDVDMNTYTHLLSQVHSHAQSGHVSMAVYNILKSFIAREASWKSQVTSDAVMTESVSPKWYSLLNRSGLKGTGFGFTQTTPKKIGGLRSYGMDYFTAEPRNFAEQPGYLGQIVPEQYYGDVMDAITGQTVDPAQYQSIQQQQGYQWQQPTYQKAQQTKWFPQQLNHYFNYVNAPFVY